MKKNILYILMILGLIISSCSNDDYVDIYSLNTFGQKVCRNNKVKTFVSVDTSDKVNTKYSWGCTGGSFTSSAGLFENVWVSPDDPGEYEIWVTVECNGEKETRRAKITVTDELFYTDFETPYYNEGFSNNNMAWAQDAATGSARLTSSNNNGRARKVWDKEIVPPHSMQMKFKWDQMNAKTDPFRMRLKFKNENQDLIYWDYVEFEMQMQTGDALWRVQVYNSHKGGTIAVTIPVENSPVLNVKKNIWTCGAISIDKDLNMYYYQDGTLISKVNVKELLEQQGVNYSKVVISESMVSMYNKLRMYFDDWTNLDDGTIMTGTDRDR